MAAEHVLIEHDGYTTAEYPVCGDYGCTLTVLRAIGVPEKAAADMDGSFDLDDKTTVEVRLLGESDSCEFCATCGAFIRHGLTYPNDDMGCKHDEGETPPDRPGPHIDLQDNPVMREYWAGLVNFG